jgi:Tol biopolymer transport system component
MNADGSGVINLAYNPDREDYQPVWSPDSHWIAFISSADIYVVRADDSDVRLITPNIGSDINPGWLPWK